MKPTTFSRRLSSPSGTAASPLHLQTIRTPFVRSPSKPTSTRSWRRPKHAYSGMTLPSATANRSGKSNPRKPKAFGPGSESPSNDAWMVPSTTIVRGTTSTPSRSCSRLPASSRNQTRVPHPRGRARRPTIRGGNRSYPSGRIRWSRAYEAATRVFHTPLRGATPKGALLVAHGKLDPSFTTTAQEDISTSSKGRTFLFHCDTRHPRMLPFQLGWTYPSR